MKPIYRNICLILLALPLFLTVSCVQEEIRNKVDTGGNALSLHITSRSSTAGGGTESGSVAENTCADLRLMGFQTGVSVFDQQPDVIPGVTDYPLLGKGNEATDEDLRRVLMSRPTDLVVLANTAGTGIVLPATGAPQTEFEAFSYPGVASPDVLNYFDDTHHPLMTAKKMNDFSTTAVVRVGLERVCAKLRVRVVNRTGEGTSATGRDDNYLVDASLFRVLNVPASQKLLSTASGAPLVSGAAGLVDYPQAASGLHTETSGRDTWAFYCYLNESNQQKSTDPALRTAIEVVVPYRTGAGTGTGDRKNYRYLLPLKQEIRRNTIYELTVNIYGPGESIGQTQVNAELNIQIKEWDEVTADPIG